MLFTYYLGEHFLNHSLIEMCNYYLRSHKLLELHSFYTRRTSLKYFERLVDAVGTSLAPLKCTFVSAF